MAVSKIVVVAGHSGTGKDTLTAEYPSLSFAMDDDCENIESNVVKVVPFTNREKRPGEEQGKSYDFFARDVDPHEIYAFRNKTGIDFYESRTYDVFAPDGSKRTDLYGNYIGLVIPNKTYVVLGQVSTYLDLMTHLVKEKLTDKVEASLIYLNTDPKTRRDRMLIRERLKEKPNFQELNRRVVEDEVAISSKDPVKPIINQVIKWCLIEDINEYKDNIIKNITIMDASGTIEENKEKFNIIIS